MRTLQVLVTCCMEPSRTDVLKRVVANLIASGANEKRHLFVFDNASSDPQTIDILRPLGSPVYRASRNVGYWSAIMWSLQNLPMSELTYFIESDEIHYDYDGLLECENFMLDPKHCDVGSLRLEEFSVADFRLYDKSRPSLLSKKHAWTTLRHPLTGRDAFFSAAEGRIFRTDLPPKLCGLNRRSMMRFLFERLSSLQQISERDFQKMYYELYANSALIDGGIFSVPSTYESLAGSYITAEQQIATGYQPTRVSKIVSDFEVELLT